MSGFTDMMLEGGFDDPDELMDHLMREERTGFLLISEYDEEYEERNKFFKNGSNEVEMNEPHLQDNNILIYKTIVPKYDEDDEKSRESLAKTIELEAQLALYLKSKAK